MSSVLRDKVQDIINHSFDSDDEQLIIKLKQLLRDVDETQYNQCTTVKSLSELVASCIDVFRKLSPISVINTGFEDFDEKFGGFCLGELAIIGGRPGMGKTSLISQLALNISKEIPTLLFGFDTSEFILTNRFISLVSGIPIQRILQQKLSNEELASLIPIQNQLGSHKLFINDYHNRSIDSFRMLCQKYIEEEGVKIIMIDYLQMMGLSKYNNRREVELRYIVRELKNIAKDFNVCVVVTSQLSRNVECRPGHKRPMLSDLSDSGSIEQVADKVIFIYRPEYYKIMEWDDEVGTPTDGQAEFIIAKNKNGNIGSVGFDFLEADLDLKPMIF
ncbi:MAG: DnaB-like helicase C-terminal domain-containing protein [Capnocytophaga felis]|nr:DnaB-like helicase C-terminal domain-containing protein [Capnocytophaga felis]